MKRVLSVLALMAIATAAQAGVIVQSSLVVTNLRLVRADGTLLQAGVDYQLTPSPPTISVNPSQVPGSAFGSATATSVGNVLTLPGVTGTTVAGLNLPDSFTGAVNEALASITSNSSFTAARNLSGVKALFDVQAFVDVSRPVTGANPDPTLPLGNGRGETELTFGVSGFGANNLNVILVPPANFNLVQNGIGRKESGPTSFTTQSFNIEVNRTYGLTATQTSTAAFSAVPEPSSICIFGAMGVAGLAMNRRRKAVKKA
ncbi:MAG: PEP-CTERM sorting domain-containing protein [Rubripirellula sp.]